MAHYFTLENHSFTISTQSEQAQLWFGRGLEWCYGFNQEEAVRCFQNTIAEDPECAMGYWGIAYATGPFYNKPWEWYGEQERGTAITTCHDASQKALQLCLNSTLLEQHLIRTLCNKFPSDPASDPASLNQAEQSYAFQMRCVLKQFPDNLDLICLTAEALMNLNRWQLWDIRLGIHTEGAHTAEIYEILEYGLSLSKQTHAGILHFLYSCG